MVKSVASGVKLPSDQNNNIANTNAGSFKEAASSVPASEGSVFDLVPVEPVRPATAGASIKPELRTQSL